MGKDKKEDRLKEKPSRVLKEVKRGFSSGYLTVVSFEKIRFPFIHFIFA